MPIEENNPHRSVRIRSDILKKDRKSAGFTQSAFSAACRSVSLSTIRRAEQGYRVTEPAAKKMAQILDQPVERYVLNPEEDNRAEYVAWLAGEWTSFHVEVEKNNTPRLIPNEVRIRQNGGQVVGEINNSTTNKPTANELFKAEVINNVMTGGLFGTGDGAVQRLGTFCCLVKRNNNWIEGSVSFVNRSGEAIESTRIVAIRNQIPDFDRYVQEAKTVVEQEIAMFRVKQLLEAGYKLDDAIVMLAALRAEAHSPTSPRN